MRPTGTTTAPGPAAVKSLFITRKQLADVLGCSTPTLDRMRAAGKIGPHPVRIGVGTAGLRWHAEEVREWADHRTPAGGLMDAKQWAAHRAARQR
jgi:predicted DNA-binding transcriptional regulator AlpA